LQNLLSKVKIEFVETLNGGPAKIRVFPNDTAHLFLALDYWNILPYESKVFVVLHELGHFKLKSSDEIEVDKWAFKQYVKMGLPVGKSVFALTRVLDAENNEEHAYRIKRQFYRSKHDHFKRTGCIKTFINHKI